jgi:hypothetical protein
MLSKLLFRFFRWRLPFQKFERCGFSLVTVCLLLLEPLLVNRLLIASHLQRIRDKKATSLCLHVFLLPEAVQKFAKPDFGTTPIHTPHACRHKLFQEAEGILRMSDHLFRFKKAFRICSHSEGPTFQYS